MQSIYHIKLTNNTKIVFENDKKGDVLLCGFIDGMFGEYDEVFKCFGYCDEVAENNVQMLIDTIKNGNKIRVVGDDLTIKYMNDVLCDFISGGIFKRKEVEKTYKGLSCGTHYDADSYSKAIAEQVNRIYKYSKVTNMKFDYIIQNPPYSGSLHLEFLEKGLDLLKEDGKMVIIEPATWLINVRKNGKAKKYDAIKKRIEGHVESVAIENLNKDFGTAQDFPFAITTIDMSKKFESIRLVCCGEKKEVKSIYDCNLVGDYDTISSILEKTEKYPTSLQKRIYKGGDAEAFVRFWNYQLYALGSNYGNVANQYRDKTIAVYRENAFGNYFSSYVDSLFYENVQKTVPLSKKKGNPCDCLFGTEEELNNWIYNVKNCKLFMFLTSATILDKHNEARYVTPFLCDKKYTDEEINKMFGFTDEEIALINHTVKKFEYDSPWFKRYMCGPDSVSDEEVNNFIKNL